MYQKTIRKFVEFKGVGIHTGCKTRILIKPASLNCGILFRRIDFKNEPKIKVDVKNLRSGDFRTILKKRKIEIQTVEHLLASLFGLGIDNAEIEIDNNEVPALDGSSLEFTKKIYEVGVNNQKAKKKFITLEKSLFVKSDDKLLIAVPYSEFKITYFLSHPHKLIGDSIISFKINPENFKKGIAPARTFATMDEAKKLRNTGLALGGTPENAVVVDKTYSTKLRFKDEFARHKILDLIGDLSILGYGLKMHIIGIKSGHFLNHLLIKKIDDFKKVIV